MTYAQLNINQRINFKSWFTDTICTSTVEDLYLIHISDTCISAIEGERHPTEWRYK